MIISFNVSIEVSEIRSTGLTKHQTEEMDLILTEMEEVAAKLGYSIHDQNWEVEQ